jgi:enoyl-CoA hydratase/carnithine racemase
VPAVETLQLTRDGGILTVTLDRPEKKNAINGVMWDELKDVLRGLVTSTDDRVVVLTGAGGAFCSGADLSSVGGTDLHQLQWMRHVGEVALALHDVPQPTIAKVVGVAAGYGANLAFGCDLIIASDDARFSEIFARRGLSIDGGGSWLLPRLIGLHKAKELAFFADIISAADAAALGVVNRVVPAAEIDVVVDELARRLAAGPALALSMTKRLLNASFARSMGEALEAEAMAQTVNFGTDDMREAMAAFAEKREPDFRGR